MAFLKNKYILALVSLGVNLLIYGYSYGNNSYHDYLLCYIHKLIDPSLYPNDLYLSTLSSFPSVYIYIMAFLAKWAPLATVHFAVYIFIKYLFFSGYLQLGPASFFR